MRYVVDRPAAWRRAGLIAAGALHMLALVAVLWPRGGTDADARGVERLGASTPLRVSLIAADRAAQPPAVRLPPAPAATLPQVAAVAVPALPVIAREPTVLPAPPPSPMAKPETETLAAGPAPAPAAAAPSHPLPATAASAGPAARTGQAKAAPAHEHEAAEPATVALAPAAKPAAGARPVPARADRRHCPSANYPALLRSRGIEGTVQLRVQVAPDGRAAAVELLQGSGFRLLDEAALAQARGCRFEPARRGSEPVESWVEFPVHFALHGAA
jgi:periplasmic protein TonB